MFCGIFKPCSDLTSLEDVVDTIIKSQEVQAEALMNTAKILDKFNKQLICAHMRIDALEKKLNGE